MKRLASIAVAILLVFALPTFSAARQIPNPDNDRGKHLGQQKDHDRNRDRQPQSVPEPATSLQLLTIGLAAIAAARAWQGRRK